MGVEVEMGKGVERKNFNSRLQISKTSVLLPTRTTGPASAGFA
jgi:hypothetical protein